MVMLLGATPLFAAQRTRVAFGVIRECYSRRCLPANVRSAPLATSAAYPAMAPVHCAAGASPGYPNGWIANSFLEHVDDSI
jgi:hypothetical protein